MSESAGDDQRSRRKETPRTNDPIGHGPGRSSYDKAMEVLSELINKDLKRAVSLLEEAIELEPANPAYLNALALLYADPKVGEEKHAVSLWAQVLQISSGGSLATAKESYAAFLCNKGIKEKNPERFYEALDIDPTHCEAHKQLGIVFQKKHDYERAVSHLVKATRAASSQSTKAELLDRLGTCYIKEGKFDQAIKAWEEALQSKHWSATQRTSIQQDLKKASDHL